VKTRCVCQCVCVSVSVSVSVFVSLHAPPTPIHSTVPRPCIHPAARPPNRPMPVQPTVYPSCQSSHACPTKRPTACQSTQPSNAPKCASVCVVCKKSRTCAMRGYGVWAKFFSPPSKSVKWVACVRACVRARVGFCAFVRVCMRFCAGGSRDGVERGLLHCSILTTAIALCMQRVHGKHAIS
jgi:hypothetical protein